MNLIELLMENKSFKEQVKYSYTIYKAKQIILNNSVANKNLYIVCSGKVRVYLLASIKNDKILHPGVADLCIGEVFGELGLFNEPSGIADVVAITNTELIEIDIQSFEIFLDNHPEIGYKVLREILHIVINRLKHSNQSLVNLLAWGIKNHRIDEELE